MSVKTRAQHREAVGKKRHVRTAISQVPAVSYVWTVLWICHAPAAADIRQHLAITPTNHAAASSSRGRALFDGLFFLYDTDGAEVVPPRLDLLATACASDSDLKFKVRNTRYVMMCTP